MKTKTVEESLEELKKSIGDASKIEDISKVIPFGSGEHSGTSFWIKIKDGKGRVVNCENMRSGNKLRNLLINWK